MSDILGKIKSGAGKVAKEADKAVDIRKIEMAIGGMKKEIEANYHTLGQMTYDSSIKNEPAGPEAANIIAKITDLYNQIAAREKDIQDIKDGKIVAQPSGSGKKFCPSCGKENDPKNKFCASCGAQMP
jgi:hypothetical protein